MIARPVAFVAALVVGLPMSALPSARQAAAQQFRGVARVVPVDVRVLDERGQPITDLTRDDFVVLDNGREQTIAQFLTQTLPAATSLPAAGAAVPPAPGATSTSREAGRVFLLQLGRGRHTGPSKGIDAAIDFVRDRVSDADRVGVLAYNRATPFTANRRAIAAVLERFRVRHERIEARLQQRFSGLAGLYGSPEIPSDVQALIDAIFDSSDLTAAPVGSVASAAAADLRVISDRLLQAGIDASRETGLRDRDAERVSQELGLSLDEFVELTHEVTADLGNLYKAVAFLRHVDGEKHLVFVTPKGIYLPRDDLERDFALMAADARVAVHTIYTDSPSGPPRPTARQTHVVAPTFAQRSHQVLNLVLPLRETSRLTGGDAFAFQYSREAFDRIATTTGFQYVLGYTPDVARWDGRFRQIEVRVRRPGARLSYRRGYYATEAPPPLDIRAYMTSYRMGAAETSATEVRAGIRAQALNVRRSTGADGAVVSFDLLIDRESRLGFAVREGMHVARVEMAVAAGNERGRTVGSLRATLDLRLDAEAYERFQREGLRRRVDVPVTGTAEHLKVTLYAYDADALGTASARVR